MRTGQLYKVTKDVLLLAALSRLGLGIIHLLKHLFVFKVSLYVETLI
jgi:hypothetical protein